MSKEVTVLHDNLGRIDGMGQKKRLSIIHLGEMTSSHIKMAARGLASV